MSTMIPILTIVKIKVILFTMVTLRRDILEPGSAWEAIAAFSKTRTAGSLPTVINPIAESSPGTTWK